MICVFIDIILYFHVIRAPQFYPDAVRLCCLVLFCCYRRLCSLPNSHTTEGEESVEWSRCVEPCSGSRSCLCSRYHTALWFEIVFGSLMLDCLYILHCCASLTSRFDLGQLFALTQKHQFLALSFSPSSLLLQCHLHKFQARGFAKA